MKIAIIGTGISGLAAAYGLDAHSDVTVFEADNRLGGHSRTIDVPVDGGTVPVDTGFIVFNHGNYPHLTALFQHLQVPTAKSNMSFGACIDDGFLEYSSRGVFAQKRNFFRPAFWGMIRDIIRFNRIARDYVQDTQDLTLGELLTRLKMGRWFQDYYLKAMGAAIWSMPMDKMAGFPARTFIQFFANHGLLAVRNHPQWYTVMGGSRVYVDKIRQKLRGQIWLNCPVVRVVRQAGGVHITDGQGRDHVFDRVVFACHGDQTARMIGDAQADEADVLGAFGFSRNRVVTHRDLSFMPRARAAWASWVYQGGARSDQVSLSYWMNNLQPLDTQEPIIITLNPGRDIDPRLIINEHEFDHPIFDAGAIAAQGRLPDIQGRGGYYYAGAYWRYGFHEDGILSAVQVLKAMGVNPPWM